MKNHAILVAEDNDDDYFIFERAMKALFSVQVRRVRDGIEAESYVSGTAKFADRTAYPKPLLMILDLKMPLKHGFEVLQWLRKDSAAQTLPVIVLSSSELQSDVHLAYELGANAYMAKPSTIEGMTNAIHAIESFWVKNVCFDLRLS